MEVEREEDTFLISSQEMLKYFIMIFAFMGDTLLSKSKKTTGPYCILLYPQFEDGFQFPETESSNVVSF